MKKSDILMHVKEDRYVPVKLRNGDMDYVIPCFGHCAMMLHIHESFDDYGDDLNWFTDGTLDDFDIVEIHGSRTFRAYEQSKMWTRYLDKEKILTLENQKDRLIEQNTENASKLKVIYKQLETLKGNK